MSQNTPTFLTSLILWGAMLFSNAIYVFIAVFMSQQEPAAAAQSAEDTRMFLMVFGLISVVEAPLALMARKFLIGKMVRESEEPITPLKALGIYQSASLIGWSLAESISIYGLVLFFLSRELWTIYPFVGVGALLIAITYPRRGQIDAIISPSTLPEDTPDGAAW